MCDYSLMSVPNRLAQQSEDLVTHRFPTGSLGLASPADIQAAHSARPAIHETLWQKLQEFFDPPAAPAVCAVCIPPGARLSIREIPPRIQQQWGVGEQEEAVFTQMTAAVNTYRDALRLSGGREVRLQDLREGIKIRVMDLSGTEEPSLEALRALG